MPDVEGLQEDDRDALPARVELRRIRLAAGLTQAELAARLGVSRPTVTRYECGLRQPRGEQAASYARLIQALAGGRCAA